LTPVVRDPLQVDPIRVGRLHLDDDRVSVWKRPQAVKAHLTWRAAIPAVDYRIAQAPANLVDDVLQGEAAASEGCA
jgi:hypothetical protein